VNAMQPPASLPATPPDWRQVFCGRADELERMVSAFEEVRSGQGPRLVVVLGDRGMGKTRLAQELYRELARRHDAAGYWPDLGPPGGRTQQPAPDFDDPHVRAHYQGFTVDERPLPYLWWGLRPSDPASRNATRSDLATHRATLEPHLAPVVFARRAAFERERLKRAGVDASAELGKKLVAEAVKAIPGVGVAATALEVILQFSGQGRAAAQALWGHRRLADQQRSADAWQLHRDRSDDLLQRTLDDLAALLAPGEGLAPLPVVVFCDDAQFAGSGGDEGALRLLDELWQRAHLSDWPLLLVLGHWASDWRPADGAAETRRCADVFRRAAGSAQSGCLIDLAKASDLEALVRAGVPGLPAEDIALLAGKADGNPQVLVELIELVLRSKAMRGADGALKPHARRDLLQRPTDLARLICERLGSDATPESVRQAVAISAMQGLAFARSLTVAAAGSLGIDGTHEGLQSAAQRHRLVADVGHDAGEFVQRAYHEAAMTLVAAHVDDPDRVQQCLLDAALAATDGAGVDAVDGHASAQRGASRHLALGVLAGLGAEHPQAEVRHRAAGALLELVERAMAGETGADPARAAALARRFEQGLGTRWHLDTQDPGRLHLACEALYAWDGAPAAQPLTMAVVRHARASAAQPGDDRRRYRALKAALYLAGRVAQDLGDHGLAGALFAEGLAAAEKAAVSSPQDEQAPDDVAMFLEKLAEVATPGDPERARELLTRCLVIARTGLALRQSPEARHNVAISLCQLAEVEKARGQWARVEALGAQALQMLRPLSQDWPTPLALCSLGLALHYCATAARAMGRLDEAEALARENLELSRRLAREQGTVSARRDLAVNLGGLAVILEQREALADAEALHQEALELERLLDRHASTPTSRSDIAVSMSALARLAEARGDVPRATRLARESLEHWRALMAEQAGQARRGLIVDLNQLADLLRAQGDWPAAEALYLEAHELAQDWVARSAEPEARRDLAVSLTKLAKAAEARGDVARALTLVLECARTCRDLVEEVGTPQAWRDLGLAFFTASHLSAKAGSPTQALDHARQALPCFQQVERMLGTPRAAQERSVVEARLSELGA
jgi:tetratricopeptide (TPR) repeat protein